MSLVCIRGGGIPSIIIENALRQITKNYQQVSSGSISLAQSQVIGLSSALAGKADSSAVVHLAASETITGSKTFSSNVSIANSADVAALTLRGKSGQTHDIYQVKNAAGAILHSVGCTGRHVISTDNTDNTQLQFNGPGTTNPFEFRHATGGTYTGVVDNVFAMGWQDPPVDQPLYTHNLEQRWFPGSAGGGPQSGTTEDYNVWRSIDQAHQYRPLSMSVDNSNGNTNVEWRIQQFKVFSPDTGLLPVPGSIPVLTVLTGYIDGTPDSGQVIIQNDGSRPPFTVIAPGNTDVNFQLWSGSHVVFQSTQVATSGSTTRNSPGIQLGGAYWNGSMSVGANATIQVQVTGNAQFWTRIAGSASFEFNEQGQFSFNAGDGARSLIRAHADRALTMLSGYLSSLNDSQSTTYRLVGLDGSNKVSVDPDARGVVLGTGLTSFSGSDGSAVIGSHIDIQMPVGSATLPLRILNSSAAVVASMNTDGSFVMNAIAGNGVAFGNGYGILRDSGPDRLGIFTNAGEVMTFRNTTNFVGFGSAFPSANIHVFGSNPSVAIEDGNGSRIILNAVNGFPIIGTTSNDAINFRTNGTDRANLDTSGNFNVIAGNVRVGGGVATKLVNKTAAYTATTTDSVITADATSAAFALTLPAANAVAAGRQYTFKKVDSSAHAVTVTAAGSDAIDSSPTYALATQFKFTTLVSDGVSQWYVISSN